MKVLLWSDYQKNIANSGVGRARSHQMMALESQGVTVVTDPHLDYDIIHINTIFPQSYVRAKQARRAGKPVVYHAHSTAEDFRNSFKFSNCFAPIFKQWLKRCYNTADLILTPSDYSKELLESYPLRPEIAVLSNGIDLNYWKATPEEIYLFRKKYHISSDDKLIISCGLQIKRKGLLDFVKLAQELPQYQFIWFGYTNHLILPKEILLALKTQLPNLTFAGYVPRETMRVAYHAADCFLFPTYEETEGIVLLEALASKTNVVVRDIPVFNHYQDSYDLYKARTLTDFKQRLTAILEGGLPTLVENGWDQARARSISEIGATLVRYYERAMTIHSQHDDKLT